MNKPTKSNFVNKPEKICVYFCAYENVYLRDSETGQSIINHDFDSGIFQELYGR
jgi:hypothetical protein